MDITISVSRGLVICTVILMIESFLVLLLGTACLLFYLIQHLSFVHQLYGVVPYYFLAIGLFSLGAGFYGLCAVSSGNKFHFSSFSFLLFIVFLTHLIGIFMTNELRVVAQSRNFATAEIKKFAREYQFSPYSRRAWDQLQSYYVCCGWYDTQTGYEIWRDILIDAVPDSCCLDITPGCGANIFWMNSNNIHTQINTRGCMHTLEQTVITELCPYLQAFVVGDLLMTMMILMMIFLSSCVAYEIHADEVCVYEPDEECQSMTGNRFPGFSELMKQKKNQQQLVPTNSPSLSAARDCGTLNRSDSSGTL